MSETCYARLAGNAGRKKIAQKSPSEHHRTTLSGYIFATKARIDNQKKNLLNSNVACTCMDNRKKNLLSSDMSSTCPHNIPKSTYRNELRQIKNNWGVRLLWPPYL